MLGIILWAAAVAAPRTDFCILSAEEQGSALAILAPDGKLRARVEVGAWPHEVEVSLDGRTAYVTQFGLTDYDSRVGAPGDHVARIDLATATVTGRYQLPENLRAPHGVKLRPGTDELFVNAESGGDTMLVYDAAAGRLVRTFPLGKGSHNFVFSRDGRFVFVFAGAEGVAKYDASNGNLLVSQVLDTPVRGLRLAADGTVVAAAKGKVAVLDPRNLRVRRWLAAPVAGQLVYLETLTDGTIVAPSMDDNGVPGSPRTVGLASSPPERGL